MSANERTPIPYVTSVVTGALATRFWCFRRPDPAALAILERHHPRRVGLINTQWLISIHATAAAATWMIATLVFRPNTGLIPLPLLVLTPPDPPFLRSAIRRRRCWRASPCFSAVLLMRAFAVSSPESDHV